MYCQKQFDGILVHKIKYKKTSVKKKCLTEVFLCAILHPGELMDKNFEHALLYDFYGPLLTEKQRRIYEEVKFCDLSLSEASESFGISRQGVHDALRRVEKSLEGYEEKLGLVKQFREIKSKAEEIREICGHLQRADASQAAIQRILQLTEDIEGL